jgi:hypothetical protein
MLKRVGLKKRRNLIPHFLLSLSTIPIINIFCKSKKFCFKRTYYFLLNIAKILKIFAENFSPQVAENKLPVYVFLYCDQNIKFESFTINSLQYAQMSLKYPMPSFVTFKTNVSAFLKASCRSSNQCHRVFYATGCTLQLRRLHHLRMLHRRFSSPRAPLLIIVIRFRVLRRVFRHHGTFSV